MVRPQVGRAIPGRHLAEGGNGIGARIRVRVLPEAIVAVRRIGDNAIRGAAVLPVDAPGKGAGGRARVVEVDRDGGVRALARRGRTEGVDQQEIA
jgi:hypothetical protein